MSSAPALPAEAPPSLASAYASLSPERKAALHEHLMGGTSAAYLSDWMKRAGAPVGATTIKTFRQRLRRTT